MCEATRIFDGKRIAHVCFERCLWQEFDPACLRVFQPFPFILIGMRATHLASLERTLRGMISREKGRIHYAAANHPRQSKTDHTPVIPGCSPASRHSSVHPFSACCVFPFDVNWVARFQQALLGTEEFIIAFDHPAPTRSDARSTSSMKSVIYHLLEKHVRPGQNKVAQSDSATCPQKVFPFMQLFRGKEGGYSAAPLVGNLVSLLFPSSKRFECFFTHQRNHAYLAVRMRCRDFPIDHRIIEPGI